MSTAFLVAAILCAAWGVINAVLIAIALDKRGIRVNMVLFRLTFFRYLSRYRAATLSETGKVGSLYYSYIISMGFALVCAVAGLILRT
jgi:hypothetical protein